MRGKKREDEKWEDVNLAFASCGTSKQSLHSESVARNGFIAGEEVQQREESGTETFTPLRTKTCSEASVRILQATTSA